MLQTPASREVLEGPMWVSKVRSEDEAGVIVVLTSGHVFFQSLITLDAAILFRRTRETGTRMEVDQSSKL